MRARRAALLLLLLVAGCSFFSPTITVKEAGDGTVYSVLNANVLTRGTVSTATTEVLHSHDLSELAEDDPRAALCALHAATVRDPRRDEVFALAELSYAVGLEDDDRGAFLASAAYAWFYLFGTEDPVPANPYDRRFRWACDLYNTALLRACSSDDGESMQLGEGTHALPVGSLHVALDLTHFPWLITDYSAFVPGDRFLIRGLSLRLRDSGLGVPLIGIPSRPGLLKTPATAFVRFGGRLADMDTGLEATLELHSGYDTQTVSVDDQTVPLERDLSITLAYALNTSPLWKFSLTGLFEGQEAVHENRLIMVQPYQPGRIPVVFVHGTASNPAYWAEMFNMLLGDRELRGGVQFWFFQYATGNPLLYSADSLRTQLTDTLARLDPDGKDPALRQMVLVGHSQGGLLIELLAMQGSLDWIREATGTAAEDFGFDERQMALVRRLYEFAPCPFVKRLVFIATPQRGSYRSARWFSRMVNKLISLPGDLQSIGDRMTEDEVDLPSEFSGSIPTSFDNMNPASPLLKILAHTPIASGVPYHSIIAIGDADPSDPESLQEADDGIVRYVDAHLDGAQSELLVPGFHSCQSQPRVIQEVRRILLEHLRVK